MDTKTLVASLEARAFQARIAFYKVCKRAHVSSATIARWKGEESKPHASTVAKIEAVLDEIERERIK